MQFPPPGGLPNDDWAGVFSGKSHEAFSSKEGLHGLGLFSLE